MAKEPTNRRLTTTFRALGAYTDDLEKAKECSSSTAFQPRILAASRSRASLRKREMMRGSDSSGPGNPWPERAALHLVSSAPGKRGCQRNALPLAKHFVNNEPRVTESVCTVTKNNRLPNCMCRHAHTHPDTHAQTISVM